MASESQWIRLNVDWDESDWVFALAEGAQLAWVRLLCAVKREGRGGRVRRLSAMVAAGKWRVTIESAQELIKAALSVGAIREDGDSWVLANWDSYQNPEAVKKANQRASVRDTSGTVGGQVPDTLSCTTDDGLRKTLGEESPKTSLVLVSVNPEPKKQIPKLLESDWLRFKAAYPRRAKSQNYPEGRRRLEILVKAGADIEHIVTAAITFREASEASGDVGSPFIPHMSTWLNQKRFEDEIGAAPKRPGDDRRQPVEGLDYRLKVDGDDCIPFDIQTGQPFDGKAWFQARNLHPIGRWAS